MHFLIRFLPFFLSIPVPVVGQTGVAPDVTLSVSNVKVTPPITPGGQPTTIKPISITPTSTTSTGAMPKPTHTPTATSTVTAIPTVTTSAETIPTLRHPPTTTSTNTTSGQTKEKPTTDTPIPSTETSPPGNPSTTRPTSTEGSSSSSGPTHTSTPTPTDTTSGSTKGNPTTDTETSSGTSPPGNTSATRPTTTDNGSISSGPTHTPTPTSTDTPSGPAKGSSTTDTKTTSSKTTTGNPSTTRPTPTDGSSTPSGPSNSPVNSSSPSPGSRTVEDNIGADKVTTSDPQDLWGSDDPDPLPVPGGLDYLVPNAEEENAAAPSSAAPKTTTYPAFTATIASSTLTLAYSGEVLPVQTSANHTPPPASFVDDILDTLASDPDTAPYGELLRTMPGVLTALDSEKNYIIYAPAPSAVAAILHQVGANPNKKKRELLVLPAAQQQIAERPSKEIDLTRVAATLNTSLKGITKFVDLGPGEGARIVSLPTSDPESGKTFIISGLGHASSVQAKELSFKNGIVKKCDSFFTYPRDLSIVLAKRQGRIWNLALKKAGLLDELRGKQGITVFAVRDKDLDAADLPSRAILQRLQLNELAYGPSLTDNQCLDTRSNDDQLLIRREGGNIKVNGVSIVKSNVIGKNGVVHYLEKIPNRIKCHSAGVVLPAMTTIMWLVLVNVLFII